VKKLGVGLVVVVAAGGFAASAWGDYTPIQPPLLGEPSHQQILSHLYGTSFSASGLNFVGANGVSVTRLHDFGSGGVVDFRDGSLPGADELFTGGNTRATATAVFSASRQQFGLMAGNGAEAGFQKGFETQGLGYNASGSFTVDLADQTWTLARRGGLFSGQRNLQTSVATDNPFDLDHLVTYRVEGPGGQLSWLLFWEDSSIPGLRDFNDLVVEIQAIPAPAALLLGGIGLAMVGIGRRWLA